MTSRMTDRNSLVLIDHSMGMTLQAVATRHGLTRNRVWQIIQSESARERVTAKAYGHDRRTWVRHMPVLDALADVAPR